MNEAAKRRCIVLALLLLVFACSAVGYSYKLYSYDITDGVINLENDVGEVYVDGEDFTPFGWLLGGIFNIMMWPVLYAIFAVVFLCVCLIGIVLFHSTCLGDKTEKISSREAQVASRMFGGIWGFCVGCIYVWPLRKSAGV